METSVVLVLIVGLPGSGKTTLCKGLKSYHEENGSCGRLVVVHVCYDKLIPLSVQREFVEQKRTEGEGWEKHKKTEGKEERADEKIIGKEVSIKKCRTTEENETSGNRREGIVLDWKNARRGIYSQVEQLLQYIFTSRTDSGVRAVFDMPIETLESDKYVILLDDNFYYRSMRYEFFQLARRYSAAFCQLYIECSTEEAVLHNSLREESVPAEVVTVMGARLQPPQPHFHPWEANTCVLKREGEDQVSQAWGAVIQSFQRGLTPQEDREAEVAEARRCCSQNVVHQADLSLRAMVKHLVKKELQQVSEGRSQASQVAAHINAARQAVLADLRGGTEVVPSHLADAITDNNRQEFEAFLEAEMKRKCQNN